MSAGDDVGRTGAQSGKTLTFNGSQLADPVISADGKRALITSYSWGITKVSILRID